MYPRFCFQPSSISGPSLVTTTARGVIPLSVITATGMSLSHRDPVRRPIPPALLPVRHSPSRRRHRRRWWSLTPPFHPLPWLMQPLAGSFSVAVVVRVQPCLDSSPSDLAFPSDANAKGWESGSSSGENPSDGSLACLSIVKVPKRGSLTPRHNSSTLVPDCQGSRALDT